MEYIIVIGVTLILVVPIVWMWVGGIDYMNKNHPDYKGDDLFGLDEDDKTQIG
jgi:hypothetical protein